MSSSEDEIKETVFFFHTEDFDADRLNYIEPRGKTFTMYQGLIFVEWEGLSPATDNENTSNSSYVENREGVIYASPYSKTFMGRFGGNAKSYAMILRRMIDRTKMKDGWIFDDLGICQYGTVQTLTGDKEPEKEAPCVLVTRVEGGNPDFTRPFSSLREANEIFEESLDKDGIWIHAPKGAAAMGASTVEEAPTAVKTKEKSKTGWTPIIPLILIPLLLISVYINHDKTESMKLSGRNIRIRTADEYQGISKTNHALVSKLIEVSRYLSFRQHRYYTENIEVHDMSSGIGVPIYKITYSFAIAGQALDVDIQRIADELGGTRVGNTVSFIVDKGLPSRDPGAALRQETENSRNLPQ